MDYSNNNITNIKNKAILVFGLGKTGMSTINYLQKLGMAIFVSDDNLASLEKLTAQNLHNVVVCPIDDIPWTMISTLILSPGVPLYKPIPHKIANLARQAGVRIICDIELLYQQNHNACYIGVTGTNGKSTTTSLIGHILSAHGLKTAIGGNLGIPALDLPSLKTDGNYVLELSSYQLDLIDKMRVNIAVFLNITPDHLDRHGDMAGYVKAKKRIFAHSQNNDYAIIGIDDDYCRNIYADFSTKKHHPKLIPISYKTRVAGGVAIIDNILYNDIEHAYSFPLGELKYLRGVHNMQNIAASYAVSHIKGIGDKEFIRYLHQFKGLKHRLQFVRQIDNIIFINDSKATNAEATARALESYLGNIYLIAGGLPKEQGIEALEQYYPKIKHVYLIGQAQNAFALSLEDKLPYTKCFELKAALDQAYKDAKTYVLGNNHVSDNIVGNNDAVILLSPLCASWDQWQSFEHRGDAFCHYVDGIVA